VSLTADVAGTLPVANGGTGVTTSTGTGDTVRAISPTFTGTITAATLFSTGTTIQTAGSTASTSASALRIGHLGSSTESGIFIRPAADTTFAIGFDNAAGSNIGNITTTAVAVTFNSTSDARLKEDLKPVLDSGRIVDGTTVYDFAWKSTKERAYGVIAQQAIEVYPAAITHDVARDWWGVDYGRYVPVLLQEIKDLRKRVLELEAARK